MKNDEKSEPSYKDDNMYYMKNPNILANKIVEIYDNNLNAKVYNPKNKKIKLNYKMLLIKLIKMKILINYLENL